MKGSQTTRWEETQSTGNGVRRGRPPVWLAWGVAAVLCVGGRLAAGPTAAPADAPAATNAVARAANPNDPVEQELQKLLEMDDVAQDEVERWIRESDATGDRATIKDAALSLRMEQRVAPVRRAYEDFLQRHGTHARAQLAFASFLMEIGRDAEALPHLEKARDLEPQNAAAWNNLANYYGYHGPATNAFLCYQKAIELNPKMAIYLQNYASLLYLFRVDAMETFGVDEQAICRQALDLYRKAQALNPKDFVLANDLAQVYYAVKPPRHEEAIKAWENALSLARDPLQREGIFIHLARIKMAMGLKAEARDQLNQVKGVVYDSLKQALLDELDGKKPPKKSAANKPPLLGPPAPASFSASTPPAGGSATNTGPIRLLPRK